MLVGVAMAAVVALAGMWGIADGGIEVADGNDDGREGGGTPEIGPVAPGGGCDVMVTCAWWFGGVTCATCDEGTWLNFGK